MPKPWREELLDRLLVTIVPIVTLGVAMVVSAAGKRAGLLFVTCVGPMMLAVWAAAFARGWSHRVRAAILVGFFVVATFAAYAIAGFSSNSGLVAAMSVITAGLLFGRRVMLWTLAAVLLAPVLAAAGMVSGVLAAPDPAIVSFVRVLPWIRSTFVVGCMLAILGLTITYVVERIERALEEQRALLDGLRAEQTRREQAELQQREAERAMLQAQKMEVIGQLASGVAHDFNNVLSVVQVWSELGLTANTSSSEREQARLALDAATKQGAALARQLLALSRKNARVLQSFALDAAITTSMNTLSRVLPEDIAVRVEHQQPVTLHTDESELQQLLFNLVINARDAMPNGGKLTVRTGARSIAEPLKLIGKQLEPGRWAFVSVEDSGTGIAQAIQARIFEPFFTTKPIGSGTGLGLATVLSIASESGGGVALESVEGRGTIFHVYLPVPAAEASELRDGVGRRVRARCGSAKILLLEDNPLVRQVLNAILTREGHVVTPVADGRRALEEIRKTGARFDLLCTDAVVPFDPIPDVIRAFSQVNGTAPVLIVSGYVKEELTRRGIEEGHYKLLHKPFRPDELLASVDELLGPRASAESIVA